MLHYYFFKYWSRGLVGIMITFVVGYFGLFTYSLFILSTPKQQASSQSAQLSVTPQLKQLLRSDPRTEGTYQKSVQVFGEIQKLKDKKHDTTQLETLYADSVKNLTGQKTQEALSKLQEIEVQIASINETLSPTPQPSETVSGTPTVPPEPSSEVETGESEIATTSAD